MLEYEVYGVLLLPIIVGLVQIVKQLNIPNKYMPLISIGIAEAISLLFVMNGDADYRKAILIGLQMGLAAVGLHSGIKNLVPLKKKKDTEETPK